MKIPLTDLRLQYSKIKEEVNLAILSVMDRSDFILGKEVAEFEEKFASYVGVEYAVGVASGTDALVLSLQALDIKSGDEVITTPFTFIATVEAIIRVGAKPVFADIDENTFNINPSEIEKKITKKTKAIIPVHLYGLPCDMEKICEIASHNNLYVIEDCAQSLGAEINGIKVGSFGITGCFSFFPGKILGGFGDGGIITTNSKDINDKLRMLRNHGSSRKYYYDYHGYNSRLDTLQAAILSVKLKYIDEWIEKRIKNANYYNEQLKNISGIRTTSVNGKFKHSYNYYTIVVEKDRDKLSHELSKNGIASAVYYPLSLHLQDVYKDLGYKLGDFPVAEKLQNRVLSLPMYPELTKEEINEIVLISFNILR